jgi:hypothetical protein
MRDDGYRNYESGMRDDGCGNSRAMRDDGCGKFGQATAEAANRKPLTSNISPLTAAKS